MAGLIQVQIPNVGTIYLESHDVEAIELASAVDLRERTKTIYQDALNTIDSVALSLSKKMKELASQIEFSEYTAEFGVKLSAEVGAVVASAASESTIKISIKWSKSDSNK